MISWFDIVKMYYTNKKMLRETEASYTLGISVILEENTFSDTEHLPENFFHLIQGGLYNVVLNCYQAMLLRQRLLHRQTILNFCNNYQELEL